MSLSLTGRLLLLATAACTLLPLTAFAAPDQAVMTLASQNKQPPLDTLKELVNIESGSGDREGLDRISQVIFDRLKALGGEVESKVAISLKLSPATLARWKATGPGWQTRMANILRESV